MEVLVAVAILGIIATALASAFVTSAKSSAQTSQRFDESHDAQILSAYFANDVQSANTVSTTSTSCGGGQADLLVSFTNGDGTVKYTWGAGSVDRSVCPLAGAPASTTVVENASSTTKPVVTLDPTGTTMPTTVSMKVWEHNAVDNSEDFNFTVSGTRRIYEGASLPGVTGFADLFTLGTSGKGIDISGTNHYKVRVKGDIIVNSSGNPAVDVQSNNPYFQYTGTMDLAGGTCPGCGSARQYGQLAGPLLDPFQDLKPPAPGDPGVTVISASPWTPPAVIPPGIYIVQHGISLNGPSVGMGGVMLYIEGGAVNLTGHAELSLSPPTTGPYASTGLVIWQPKSNPSPMVFQASTGTFYTLYAPDGVVYAPSAAVATSSGNGRVLVKSFIVNAIKADGGGNSGVICVGMNKSECDAFLAIP